MDVPSYFHESSSLLELALDERVELLWTICSIFIPWNGDHFRTILGVNDKGVEWRTEPVGPDAKGNLYWILAGRLLCLQSPSDTWTLLAWDAVSWDVFFLDDSLNPLLKSRRPSDARLLRTLRACLPSEDIFAFDEACKRHLDLMAQTRKRSPRIQERAARMAALERLRSHPIPHEATASESRAERLARREQLKALHQPEESIADERAATEQSSPLKLILTRQSDGTFASELVMAESGSDSPVELGHQSSDQPASQESVTMPPAMNELLDAIDFFTTAP
jgi:hypothetical protein